MIGRYSDADRVSVEEISRRCGLNFDFAPGKSSTGDAIPGVVIRFDPAGGDDAQGGCYCWKLRGTVRNTSWRHLEVIYIERAAPSDVDQIVAMEQAPDTTEFIIPYSASVHAENMSDPNLVYLRIMEKGQFAGFIILALDPDGKSVEFRRIVVSAKGRGVGQTAISEMEKFCKSELRRERVWLDVFEYNRRGRHIYEKLGYRQYGSIAHESGKLLLLYEKDL